MIRGQYRPKDFMAVTASGHQDSDTQILKSEEIDVIYNCLQKNSIG